MKGHGVPEVADESALIDELVRSVRNEVQVTLLLGSGVAAPPVPRLTDLLGLAEQYAAGIGDSGELLGALEQARDDLGRAATPVDVYLAYRRVFADWISDNGFDVVMQQAVLEAFRPDDRAESPLATHGIWQSVDLALAERVENTTESWQLPPGVLGVARLLAHRPDDFASRILTTNVDPLLEVAIRHAGGRAATIPIDENGRAVVDSTAEGAVRIYHLHGFWRPMPLQARRPLLHDPGPHAHEHGPHPTPPAVVVDAVANLISGERVCVVGSGGRDGVLMAALEHAVKTRSVRVWWAHRGGDPAAAAELKGRMAEPLAAATSFFTGVDSNRLFERVAERLEAPRVVRAAPTRYRHRQPAWEFELISQPSRRPPEDPLQLLRQLEWRFGWRVGWTTPERVPSLLFWPVRLRPQPSIIHAVQALVAGALTRRGVRLVVCMDDLGLEQRVEYAQRFQAQVTRWVRMADPHGAPEFASLHHYVDSFDGGAIHPDPESLLRPTHPWAVAQMFYGQRNPSLFSVLAALKIVRNVALHELEHYSARVVRALLGKDSNRLLTPLTVWAFLHNCLLRESTPDVMTLGGRNERLFWQQWRETFQFGVNQLYNPHIKALNNQSHHLRWSSQEALREGLDISCRRSGWDREGSYVPWLVQNGMLLPGYLTQAEPAEAAGITIDSWISFRAAFDRGPAVLDTLAERLSHFYLGDAVTTSGDSRAGRP